MVGLVGLERIGNAERGRVGYEGRVGQGYARLGKVR